MCTLLFDAQLQCMHYKQALPPDTFQALLCGSLFDETAFCLGEKQGTYMVQ